MNFDKISSGLIYVIIIAIIAIVKSFSKKKEVNSSTEPLNKKKDIIDTIFGNIFEEELVKQESTSPYDEIVMEEQKEERVHKTKAAQAKPKKELIVVDLNKKLEIEEFEDEIEESEMEDFDLRRAVIYSEILKRKYC